MLEGEGVCGLWVWSVGSTLQQQSQCILLSVVFTPPPPQTPRQCCVRCFKQIWKVGKVGKVGRVCKVGNVGKVGKVGSEGLIMPTWNHLFLPVHCGILAFSWQDFLSMLAPYLARRKLIIYMNLNFCLQIKLFSKFPQQNCSFNFHLFC